MDPKCPNFASYTQPTICRTPKDAAAGGGAETVSTSSLVGHKGVASAPRGAEARRSAGQAITREVK